MKTRPFSALSCYTRPSLIPEVPHVSYTPSPTIHRMYRVSYLAITPLRHSPIGQGTKSQQQSCVHGDLYLTVESIQNLALSRTNGQVTNVPAEMQLCWLYCCWWSCLMLWSTMIDATCAGATAISSCTPPTHCCFEIYPVPYLCAADTCRCNLYRQQMLSDH